MDSLAARGLEAEERERQTMVREEAAQRQCLRAQEAAERKADYGIYASLTTHFGPLPADLFARQHRPGAFYQSHVLQAATMIERFWQHAFPFRVARKRNAARPASIVPCIPYAAANPASPSISVAARKKAQALTGGGWWQENV